MTHLKQCYMIGNCRGIEFGDEVSC